MRNWDVIHAFRLSLHRNSVQLKASQAFNRRTSITFLTLITYPIIPLTSRLLPFLYICISFQRIHREVSIIYLFLVSHPISLTPFLSIIHFNSLLLPFPYYRTVISIIRKIINLLLIGNFIKQSHFSFFLSITPFIFSFIAFSILSKSYPQFW